jgi:hypothetical protein
MSFAPLSLVPGSTIDIAPKVFYTSDQVNTILAKVTLVNLSGGEQTVTLYLVPAGESPTTPFSFTYVVPPVGSLPTECSEIEGHVLGDGGTIQASCPTAGAVSLMASGYIFE